MKSYRFNLFLYFVGMTVAAGALFFMGAALAARSSNS